MFGTKTHTQLKAFSIAWLALLGLTLAPIASAQNASNAVEEARGTHASASKDTANTEPMIVHLHLTGMMTEQPLEDPFGLSGGAGVSLRGLIDRLDTLAKDEDAAAVVITLDRFGAGLAQLEELHGALQAVRDAGKPVHIFVEDLHTAGYQAFCHADGVVMPPQSMLWLTGYYGEALYLRDLLGKIGVEGDFLAVGDYKSGAELLTRNEPSEAADENMQWLFDGFYATSVARIAEHRRMNETQVRALIDGGPYVAEEAVELGLIDAVQTKAEFVAAVKGGVEKGAGRGGAWINNRYEEEGADVNFSNPFALFASLFEPPKRDADAKPVVGVVYVEGMIQPGHGQPDPFGGTSGAFSGDIVRALDLAAGDDRVKAVVLRIDSPGGSAQASEAILAATQRVMDKKPLVVSMGNLAASGGYYVACRADEIVADPSTLTGSIGVVGGKLVTDQMWNHLGIHWHPYQRGQNADFFASKEGFRDGQRRKLNAWMHDVYDEFTRHVEEGRGDILQKPMDELAGGRVYTGAQALEYGLVDTLGGLNAAVGSAAERAGLDEYETRVIPKPKDFFTRLVEESSGVGDRPSDLAVTRRFAGSEFGLKHQADALPWLSALSALEPDRAAALRQALASMRLVGRERVAVVMPFAVVLPGR